MDVGMKLEMATDKEWRQRKIFNVRALNRADDAARAARQAAAQVDQEVVAPDDNRSVVAEGSTDEAEDN